MQPMVSTMAFSSLIGVAIGNLAPGTGLREKENRTTTTRLSQWALVLEEQ
jgi:hypothetical protein